jgi:hypothetical protein
VQEGVATGSSVKIDRHPAASNVDFLMRFRSITVLGLLFAVGGCAEFTAPTSHPAENSHVPAQVPSSALAPTVVAKDMPCIQTSHGCISLNADVTEETIRQTICVPGYTKAIRPSSSYTNGVKQKLLREAGLDESRMSDYELDHIVPLALGGHPRKLTNLALQPWVGEHGAWRKDSLEIRLRNMVCQGEVTLNDAQVCIAEDWEACAVKYR